MLCALCALAFVSHAKRLFWVAVVLILLIGRNPTARYTRSHGWPVRGGLGGGMGWGHGAGPVFSHAHFILTKLNFNGSYAKRLFWVAVVLILLIGP